MLVIAYTLLAAAVAVALYQRARRKAAEWDRDAADQRTDRAWKELDDARAEADKLAAAVESCRLHTRLAMDERDKLARELETLRGHQEQVSRAHGDAQRNAASGRIEALARVKKIEADAREAREYLE